MRIMLNHLKGVFTFFDAGHMLNPPVSNVPPERIFFSDHPFGLQVPKRGKEGVGATPFWTCRSNGWPKKNPFRAGHLRQGDLTYVPHQIT